MVDSKDYALATWNFPVDIELEYTEGSCFALAEVLSKMINSVEMYYIFDDRNRHPMHAVIKYKGMYIDILGIFYEKRLLEYWNDFQIDTSYRNKNLKYRLELVSENNRVSSDDINVPEYITRYLLSF